MVAELNVLYFKLLINWVMIIKNSEIKIELKRFFPLVLKEKRWLQFMKMKKVQFTYLLKMHQILSFLNALILLTKMELNKKLILLF